MDEPADLEQQHVVVMWGVFLQERLNLEGARNQPRLEILDRALHDANDAVPLVLGQVAARHRGHPVVQGRTGGFGITLAVDLILAVSRIEQVGEVALDDLSHLGARDGVFVGPFGLTQRRIVAQAIEERRQQLCVGAARRATVTHGLRHPGSTSTHPAVQYPPHRSSRSFGRRR
ncbi:hypothetical protein D9M70_420460 [compost metagenome]